jgi:hypothetical protein
MTQLIAPKSLFPGNELFAPRLRLLGLCDLRKFDMRRFKTLIRRSAAFTAIGLAMAASMPAQAFTVVTVNINVVGITGTCLQGNGPNAFGTSCPIPTSLNYSQQFDADLTPGTFNLANPGIPFGDPTGLGGNHPNITGLLVMSTTFPGQYSGTNFVYQGYNGAPGCTFCRTYDLRATNFSATGPVPEPGTWATMLAGFGMLGAIMRRKSPQPRVRAMVHV